MTNALVPGLGGPMGRHARRAGVFFNPLPWAVLCAALVFTVLYLRHQPCLTTEPDNPINAYVRACYTDVASHYSFQHWGSGAQLLGGETLSFSPLLGIVITATAWLARLTGGRLGEPPAHEYVGLPQFFGITAIVLFAAFLLLVWCAGAWLRREGRAWDVLFVGASPVVLASGLIAWDLFPLALTVLGLVALRAKREIEAGIVVGLAVATATMPIAFACGAVAALVLARQWRRLTLFGLPMVAVAFLLHLPQLVVWPSSVWAYYRGEMTREISFGSLWYLAQSIGAPLREVGGLTFALTVLTVGIGLAWLFVSGRRPGAASIGAAIVLVVVLLAPAYPPQTGLWVAVALVLVRPADAMLWAYAGIQLLHYLAVWGRLGGHLADDSNGPFGLYYLAVLIRVLFEATFLMQLLAGMRRQRAGASSSSSSPEPVKSTSTVVPSSVAAS